VSVRLSGPRVTLRPFRDGEFDVLWSETSRDRGAHETPWPGSAREHVREKVAGSGQWQARSSLVLAIEAEGRLIGDVQARTSADVFPPGLFELGIELFAAARGAGYGTEVLGTITRYLFDEEGARRVQLGTAVDNLAMRRAAEKAGFAFEGVMRGFWPEPDGTSTDHVLYGRTRGDHEER
jgi:RimJ/RimL family protein N-acetyltransferase